MRELVKELPLLVVLLSLKGEMTMKKQLICEIQQKMLPYLNNEQLLQLKNVLNQVFHGVTVNTEEIRVAVNKCNTVELFV